MPHDPTRRHHPVTLAQAAEQSPSLSRLLHLVQASSQRLDLVRSQLPPSLRSAVSAGPLEDGQWCLLVRGNAAAAKLRQLLPALQAHLRTKGCEVGQIRIKVQNDWT
ncbi:hypothetical protein JI739_18190 [Ramlibacter sp. AW1]|uniref:DUF721 domain-containing protein n=1 Tax=Ramlibacter aurantiacus TaxID=2801330 RepID=A0A937D346_9BURK|nr:hypothetical protein [Ramlibacter aurantiacus]MBL0422284.1 hypothetical protein [Ramlibacter aurantiacus]